MVLLSAARTHPALRRLSVDARCFLPRFPVISAPRAFTKSIRGFPGTCAVMLSRFLMADGDDPALPASTRVQAVAELLAFGADHLEDLSVTGMERLVNGAHIALAQRWVDRATRHCDVSNPVRLHVEAAAGSGTVFAAAPATVATTTSAAATSTGVARRLLAAVHNWRLRTRKQRGRVFPAIQSASHRCGSALLGHCLLRQ